MITVTLGTIPYSFDRAIAWLQTLLENRVINEQVFLQHGITDISRLASHPLVQTEPYVNLNQLINRVNHSRLVIAHAGQGSTQMLAAEGASFVLLPRLSIYKEHVDNHQLMFARSVGRFGIQSCSTIEELSRAIICPPPPLNKFLFEGPKLSDYLCETYPA
jgi:UDP-N-acetylglucosamine transferase subunit ALG13